MEWLPLLIQLVSGAAGGNIIASIAKNVDLGPIGNTIAGALGGGGGAWLLDMLMGGGGSMAGSLDVGSIIAQIISGGVGGGVLTAIAGAVRAATAK
jgi:hypothetical protein